jgi:multidrug efflux pump
MIGETTLAMLYVPLFFYLFDRLAERGGHKPAEKSPVVPPGGGTPAGPVAPVPRTESD